MAFLPLAPLPPGKQGWKYRWRYGWQAFLAYFFYGFFRIMPVAAASAIGGAVMGFVGPLMGVTRRVVLPNLAAAFPEKTEAEREIMMRGVWNNLGRVIAEYAHLHNISDRIEVVGRERFEEISRNGKPVIFFGGHLGNWEINPVAARLCGVEAHVVYRKPNNPWVDGLLRHARDAGVAGHIEKGFDGAREIISTLRQNKPVAMLVDQKLNQGMPIPFFGRDAMTADAIASLAIKFGCPLYPVRVERLDGARFRMTLYPPLDIKLTGDKPADIRAILTDINVMIEGWIRERPEQWLWTHRRWPK